MNRRGFLGCLAAGLAHQLRAQSGKFVSSDTGTLKRVLVHTPGEETRKGLGLGYSPLRFLGGTVGERAAEEHLAMVQLLRNSGAEVLTIEGVLDEAVREARNVKALEGWLRGWAPQLAPASDRINAQVLLGASDEFVYRSDEEGAFAPLTDPAGSIYWTRDSAVMTPRGVMLCHFSNPARRNEALLARFAYEWSPSLKKYPIIYDAAEEDLAMEGGDVCVVDESTIFMGVGNRTHANSARRVARRLNMDVVAVELTPQGRSPLNSLFLHLDTVCCFVDRRTVLTVPYLFEKEWTGKDPFTGMLKGLANKPAAREFNLDQMLPVLEKLGRVRRYKAGTGEPDASVDNLKLVDYLRREGYKLVFVGGAPPEGRPGKLQKHMAESVLSELRRQAANVLAIGPGKVLAYAGNRHTQKALQDAGIEVQPFTGEEIMRNNGGPHCLTQPLERT